MRKTIYWANTILFHHIIGPNLQLLHDSLPSCDKKEEIQKTLGAHAESVWYVSALHCREL